MTAPTHPFTPDVLARALPPLDGELQVSGLQNSVRILRDAYGIPHIRAESEADAFFGQGFATAQDRLWHMEYDRRRAYGRVAELQGAVALGDDRQMRRFRIGAQVAKHYQQLAPPTRAMLDSYAQGVNAFIASAAPRPAELQVLGLQPEPWLPTDSLAVFVVRHIMMGVWESKMLRARLLLAAGAEELALLNPGYPQGSAVLVPPLGVYQGPVDDGLAELQEGLGRLTFLRHGVDDGSNNWVVGGARTRSGKPLLGGDPHRALDVPNVYYQNHICCPQFDAIGFSFPGVPGLPHFAHNARVAWGITHGNGDYQDLYIEEFDPQNPRRCRHKGQWVTAECTEERIQVQGGDTETLEVWSTPRGPVIAGEPRQGRAISFRYTALADENPTFDAIYAMLQAQDATALEEAMRNWVDPVNNLVYFDLDGAFGYRTRGRIPIRAQANRWLPVPGGDGAHEWQGSIPFEEMPAVRNPACGFAYSANNRITDETYPHYIGLDFTPEFRALSIRRRLEDANKLDVADMCALHMERSSIPAQRFMLLWTQVRPRSAIAKSAHALLHTWDGQVEKTQAAPSLFVAFRLHLVRLLLAHRLPPQAQKIIVPSVAPVDRGSNSLLLRLQARLPTLIAAGDTTLLPATETWGSLMAQALENACADLQERLGGQPESWLWGRLHQTAPRHPLCARFPAAEQALSPPPFAMHGDSDTVQAAGIQPGLDYRARFISNARYAFCAADWENSRWITPSGASGHPASPHYADQAPLYAQGKTLPMAYAWQTVAAQAKTTQTLNPKPL